MELNKLLELKDVIWAAKNETDNILKTYTDLEKFYTDSLDLKDIELYKRFIVELNKSIVDLAVIRNSYRNMIQSLEAIYFSGKKRED
jgi:hypothetical protein